MAAPLVLTCCVCAHLARTHAHKLAHKHARMPPWTRCAHKRPHPSERLTQPPLAFLLGRWDRVARSQSLVRPLSTLAGPAAATGGSRNLQGIFSVEGITFPPLTDFLPPLQDLKLPNIDGILKTAGMPTWEELNLPPLEQLLMPVGGMQGVQLPSLGEDVNMADDVFNSVLIQTLPAPLQKLANLDASKLKYNITALAQRYNVTLPASLSPVKLPTVPSGLPALNSLLKQAGPLLSAVGVNTTGLNLPNVTRIWALRNQRATLPPLALPKNLPSFEEVAGVITKAQKFLALAPKPDTLPSLEQVMTVVNALNKVATALQGTSKSASG